eukprot:TRINITY_DN7828_c0_g1_i1.p1 TRINITY_DN7828_c0_g1~~TRINITY_DN7828_c0_g1_i1.p1  ORF type:complete len:607 (-),score=216.39 TRINITY_DN7828_c0_g1_i1:231-2051(-)
MAKKKPRQRDGYEDGNLLLFKTYPVQEFVFGEDPIKVMGEYNKLSFDGESAKFKEHPKTTPEVLACCDDLKVLGRGEFKLLLKWRLFMKDAFKEKKQKEEEDPADKGEEEELSSEEEEEAIDTEINQRISAISKKEKKKEKKKRLLVAKQKLRTMNSDNFSFSDDPNLFSFSKITGHLEEIASGDPIENEEQNENEETNVIPEDYDDIVEKHLENMYERYLSTTSTGAKPDEKKRKKKRDLLTEVSRPVRHQAFNPDVTSNIDDFLEKKSAPVQSRAESYRTDDDGNDDDDDDGYNDAVEDGETGLSGSTMTKKAAQWFSKSIFKGMEDLEEDLDVTLDEKPDTVAAEQHDEEKDLEELEVGDVVVSAGNSGNGFQNNTEEEVVAPAGEDDFEIVPIMKPGNESDDSDSDEEDIDADKQVKVLAMGTMMLSKKRKRELIDDSYNRYAWNDPDDLPSWFRDDENKHNKPSLPLTKELVDRVRQKFMEINARPIKKIAEAKARKKLKAIARIEKVKSKAEVISNNEEMSEKEKNRALEKLYKGRTDKLKPGKTYVVAKKSNKGRVAGGGRGVKIVDPRLKKDLKAQKRLDKKKGKAPVKGNKNRKNKR